MSAGDVTQRQPNRKPGAATLVPLAIAILVLLSLVSASGNMEQPTETTERAEDPTLVADCDTCRVGTPVTFTGTGYQGRAITVEINGLTVVTPVSEDGSVRLEWPGFTARGTYEITVYQDRAEENSAALTSLRLVVTDDSSRDRTDQQNEPPAIPADDTTTTEPQEPTTVETLPFELPSAVPDAFSAGSYWNTPIGSNAAVHPDSDVILDYLRDDNHLNGCIQLAGVPDNDWGMPVYLSGPDDPVYDVAENNYPLPPEFSSLRIPVEARPADTSDGEMVVYDLVAGVVAQLSKAVYDSTADRWSANGGSIAYLDSNGLDGRLPQSDDSRNRGTFRGYPGSVAMVHYDDVAAGKLDNVVKIGVNNAHADYVFPLVGSDGDTTNPNAPLEGTRIRIKPDVDLQALGLSGQALVIARGLQEYGMIVGDNTGGGVVLKLEDTVKSGRGTLWNLGRESLCAITTDHLEVLAP